MIEWSAILIRRSISEGLRDRYRCGTRTRASAGACCRKIRWKVLMLHGGRWQAISNHNSGGRSGVKVLRHWRRRRRHNDEDGEARRWSRQFQNLRIPGHLHPLTLPRRALPCPLILLSLAAIVAASRIYLEKRANLGPAASSFSDTSPSESSVDVHRFVYTFAFVDFVG